MINGSQISSVAQVSAVEEQQSEPAVSLTCSFVQTVLDSFIQTNDFIIHFMLLLWEAEEQKGDPGVLRRLKTIPPQTHIWKVTISIVLIFQRVYF